MTDITWEPRKVKVADLIENPQNPKITTDVGRRRLKKSIERFGPAGAIVVNTDMTIIDGHSRRRELIENEVEEVWVSVPSRPLTEEEYKEMNAMFDVSKASDVDTFMIEQLFSDDVLEEWEMKDPKKPKGEKGIYPIVPKYDERHSAIIILADTETDLSFIRTALLLDENSSYKNKSVGETHVITAKQFMKVWKAK